MSNASTTEKVRHAITTTPRENENFPGTVGSERVGATKRIVVSTATATGLATSVAPAIAALTPLFPSRRCLSMFSPRMIASSTIKPNAMMKAKSDIMLIETPTQAITMRAPRNASGMPAATHAARRGLRNRARTRRISTRP